MDWELFAACQDDADPGAWFCGPGETARHRHALDVCFSCPVRTECLAHALAAEPCGTWGGTSERERRRLRREKVNA